MASFNPALQDPKVYNAKDPASMTHLLEWSIGPDNDCSPCIVCVFCPTRPKDDLHFTSSFNDWWGWKWNDYYYQKDFIYKIKEKVFYDHCEVLSLCESVGGPSDGHDTPTAPIPLPDTLGFLVGAVCVLALISIWMKCDDLEDIR